MGRLGRLLRPCRPAHHRSERLRVACPDHRHLPLREARFHRSPNPQPRRVLEVHRRRLPWRRPPRPDNRRPSRSPTRRTRERRATRRPHPGFQLLSTTKTRGDASTQPTARARLRARRITRAECERHRQRSGRELDSRRVVTLNTLRRPADVSNARDIRRVNSVQLSPYIIDYSGTFEFRVPITQLWAQVVQLDRFPSWWTWLQDFSVDGNGIESGAVLHGVVVPPLPYRMRLDVVLDNCVPEQSMTAYVHGDLEGTVIPALFLRTGVWRGDRRGSRRVRCHSSRSRSRRARCCGSPRNFRWQCLRPTR